MTELPFIWIKSNLLHSKIFWKIKIENSRKIIYSTLMVFEVITIRFQHFKEVLHNYVHICTLLPHLILSRVQNLKSTQDHICC